jgi:hypothetical protein
MTRDRRLPSNLRTTRYGDVVLDGTAQIDVHDSLPLRGWS